MTTRTVTFSFQTKIKGDTGKPDGEKAVTEFCDRIADALVAVEGVAPEADITTKAGEEGERAYSFAVEVEYDGADEQALIKQANEQIALAAGPAKDALLAKLGAEVPLAITSPDSATIAFTITAEAPADNAELEKWSDEVANVIGASEGIAPALSIDSWPPQDGKRVVQFTATLEKPLDKVELTSEKIATAAAALRTKVEQLHGELTKQKDVPADVAVKVG
jgi:hypothetical protein